MFLRVYFLRKTTKSACDEQHIVPYILQAILEDIANFLSFFGKVFKKIFIVALV